MTHRRDFLVRGAQAAAALALGPAAARAMAPLAGDHAALPFGVGGAPEGAPAPRPRPTAAQLRWQREEIALFFHVGVNTFTDREWGDGTESPALFAPDALDARAWVRTARAAGAGTVILTAKHHDGFCLWPSRHTAHSVAASPWRDGRGDLVRELADACRAEGVGLGLYLSPWDRHERTYGDSPAYMRHYLAQVEELLTQYGPVREFWLDGANGEGPNGKRQVYDWPAIHAAVRRLQPGAVIFSDAGPDVRWIGNERGVAGETCWSTIDPAAVPYAGYDAPNVGEVLQRGHADGAVWRPGETDVSIRPGWFHHAAEDGKVKSGAELLSLYETSVGRNSKLLLNVPPDRHGQLGAPDQAALADFARRRSAMYGTDLARRARVRSADALPRHPASAVLDPDPERWFEAAPGATRATLTLELPAPVDVTALRLAEPIQLGQVVERFEVGLEGPDGTRTTLAGTTIGHARIVRTPRVRVARVTLTLASSLGPIRLARASLHAD